MVNPNDPMGKIDDALDNVEGLAETLWLASASGLLDKGAQVAVNWLARNITEEIAKIREAWRELMAHERARGTEAA